MSRPREGEQEPAPTFYLPGERATEEQIEEAVRKVADAELVASVLETVPGPAVVLNGLRQIVAANQRTLEALGVTRGISGILGQRAGEALNCVVPETAPSGCGTGPQCAYCGLANTVVRSVKNETTANGECHIALADGGALDFEVSATPAIVGDEPMVFVGLRDISGEKRREVLERTFFHDLLKTAGGIKGLLSMLEESDEQELAGDLHRNLVGLADDLISEIRSHRQLCDAEEGSLVLHPTVGSTARILSGLATSCGSHPAAHGRSIEITSDVDLAIETDLALLRRVLSNLIKNALEAIAEGDKVQIWVEQRPGEIVFAVRNPGVMPQKVKMQVFHRSFSTKGEGRGVGSYSVKLLGERYLGGVVEFSSNLSTGTTFTFALPQRRSTDPLASANPMARVEAPSARPGESPRVLVADDSRLNRLVARRQLEKLGCEVIEVENGLTAVEAWERGTFDLVLLDMNMPYLGGIEACTRIRQREAEGDHLPILALTADTGRELRRNCAEAGMDSFLTKPVDIEGLTDCLRRWVASEPAPQD